MLDIFHLENIFSENIFWIFFQVDITSSDINEFWIGQKILKAESLLLNLVAIGPTCGVVRWITGPDAFVDNFGAL